MPTQQQPPHGEDVRRIVEERLAALKEGDGLQETVSVEWRGQQKAVPVISMPVDLLTYNPATHRIRAQRSLDPVRDRELETDPFGAGAQAYLHMLLKGDPAFPSKPDQAFLALKEDLQQHGQNDPGIISRFGVLINGNTRRAALKDLGQEHIRVGVLPPDAGFDDLQSIELSLQLRKDHRRDYSYMNFLLAVDERVAAGRPAAEIQADFRIKPETFEKSRWVLGFIREAIERSRVDGPDGETLCMRLVDFEHDQGKLDELHRAYKALKAKSPDEAEALREQRLLALALGYSKTDLRHVEADFTEKYLKRNLKPAQEPSPVRIPGTGISTPGASGKVEALRALTDEALKAKAVQVAEGAVTLEAQTAATAVLESMKSTWTPALHVAAGTGRVIKRRFAAAERLGDANTQLELAITAVAEARATGNFEPDDLDESLLAIKTNLGKLAAIVLRGQANLPLEGDTAPSDGLSWLKEVAGLPHGTQ